MVLKLSFADGSFQTLSFIFANEEFLYAINALFDYFCITNKNFKFSRKNEIHLSVT